MKKVGLLYGFILIIVIVFIYCCEKETLEDLPPPNCNIITPRDSTKFNIGDTITIDVEADDYNGMVKMVILYIDDRGKFSLKVSPYQFKWSTSNDTVGFHNIRATAFDRGGNTSSDEVVIELVIGPPVVITADASSVTNNSAICGGNVVSDAGNSVTARGVCWNTVPNPTLDNTKGYTKDSTGTGLFSSYLTGLSHATTYYVRAYATNSAGTSYGEQIMFNTDTISLAITTSPVTNITSTSAVCGGEIKDDEGISATERGVCWNTSLDPTISDSKTNDGSGAGSFISSITGLEKGTTYYVRAYVTSSIGTIYGEVKEFTTLENEPVYFEYLLVSTSSGIYKVDNQGNLRYLFHGKNVEVYNKKIYTYYSSAIKEYNIDGVLISTIPIPDEVKYFIDFTILPEKGFAFLDNKYDKVYFTDLNGNFLRTVSIPNVIIDGDNHLQNINGLKVDNKIVISENGNNQIFSIDLDSYDSTILKDLSQLYGWLGAITFANNKYYICQSKKIYSFSVTEDLTLRCTLPEYHITGIVVLNSVAYVTVNFANEIFMVDLENGEYKKFVTGLSFPEDLEVFK